MHLCGHGLDVLNGSYSSVCMWQQSVCDHNVPIIQSICVPHPTVLAFVEYLWRQRVPRGRPGRLRNILSHPLPVALVGCDVTLLVFDLIGRQEAHHILLLLFDLWQRGKLSVRRVLTFSLMRKHKGLGSPYCHQSAAEIRTLLLCCEKLHHRDRWPLCY